VNARVLALVVAVLPAAGCSVGGSQDTSSTVAAPPATTATTTARVPVSPTPMSLTVYRVEHGMLRPRVVRVPRTQAVAAAALGALSIDATVTIKGRTAVVDAPAATADEVAEIVWTLTQFPSVDAVDVAGRIGLTRDDFASYVPPIVVASPAPAQAVSSPFRVAGSASVFEATLVVQTMRDGKVVSKQTVTASEGAPARGTFETTVDAAPGAITLQVFAPSAANGAPQHEVDVPLTVTP
jgi:hypothetical protein